MKSWTELTALEKREAIALRLGWTPHSYTNRYNDNTEEFHRAWDHSDKKVWEDPNHPWYQIKRVIDRSQFPDWPTNDGRAFEEVWPKIVGMGTRVSMLGLLDGVPCVYSRKLSTLSWDIRITGTIWADAICHAAYELLEVGK